MASKYGISEAEYSIIQAQASRRAAARNEFLKQRSNPFKHASEAGYVFDPAIQKYMSMKTTQFDYFQPNKRTGLFGTFAIIIPMAAYAYILWKDRSTTENKIRNGEICYRDRLFKLI